MSEAPKRPSAIVWAWALAVPICAVAGERASWPLWFISAVAWLAIALWLRAILSALEDKK
jgi:hypothetical protein